MNITGFIYCVVAALLMLNTAAHHYTEAQSGRGLPLWLMLTMDAFVGFRLCQLVWIGSKS